MVVACRVRMQRGVVSRPRRSLCPQHPESDPHDQETGQQCDIGFDRLRHESGQTKRGQHCDQDNTTGMRQRHKDAQNNRINGPPSNPDKVCRRNGLAVTRCCGVHRAEPEAAYQVKPDLAHDGVYWAKESCSAGAQTPAGTRHCMCCMPAAWTYICLQHACHRRNDCPNTCSEAGYSTAARRTQYARRIAGGQRSEP